MGKRVVAMIVVLMLASAAVATADAWYIDPAKTVDLQRGTKELSLGLAYLPSDGPADSTWNIVTSYGVFFTDDLQAGVQWWGDDDVQSVSAFGACHIGSIGGKMRPFVSGSLGYRFLDSASDRARGADDASVWSLSAGVKYFPDRESNIFLRYMYTESDDVDDDVISVGYSKLWR